MAAGGSGAPADLLAVLGIDLSGREIWDTAFDELERMIAAAESEA
jgi:oligoendopeptidase F